MAPIPRLAADITPAWLNSALRERHPDARVTGVEVIERHELTNAHARIRLEYAGASSAPPTMFAKLPPTAPPRRDTIIATGMGQREVRFYANLAPKLSLRVPETHAAVTEEDGSFALLLEDLSAGECLVSDGTWGIAPDAAAGALEDLAEMHVRFEDPARRAAEAPWVAVSSPSNAYGAPMLRYGIEHHRDRLTDAFVEISEIYIEKHEQLQALWHAGAPTVIHGDTHIGNLFMDGDRVGFLDWGIINLNTPMREVSYFLTMAMNPDDRRAHERDLLRHYLNVRRALAGTEIGWDDAWLAHRVHAAYTVPASCQVVTFPADATPARRVFADAFLARSLAALDDLEARAALREAAGI
jgi:aminoglycoside phosphotransferase (APT) family kinase protein